MLDGSPPEPRLRATPLVYSHEPGCTYGASARRYQRANSVRSVVPYKYPQRLTEQNSPTAKFI